MGLFAVLFINYSRYAPWSEHDSGIIDDLKNSYDLLARLESTENTEKETRISKGVLFQKSRIRLESESRECMNKNFDPDVEFVFPTKYAFLYGDGFMSAIRDMDQVGGLFEERKQLSAKISESGELFEEKEKISSSACLLLLPYVNGMDWSTAWSQCMNGKMPLQDMLSVAQTLGTVAAKIHKAGITHGDLHTGNIFVLPNGNSAVIDCDSITPYTEYMDGLWDVDLLSRTIGFVLDKDGVVYFPRMEASAYVALFCLFSAYKQEHTLLLSRQHLKREDAVSIILRGGLFANLSPGLLVSSHNKKGKIDKLEACRRMAQILYGHTKSRQLSVYELEKITNITCNIVQKIGNCLKIDDDNNYREKVTMFQEEVRKLNPIPGPPKIADKKMKNRKCLTLTKNHNLLGSGFAWVSNSCEQKIGESQKFVSPKSP
ncbi:MAG: phosphotransferase [Holosporales bacterium]|jgi:hypothetical protein|nr:phosphotransferase [Holosporales bacterium]